MRGIGYSLGMEDFPLAVGAAPVVPGYDVGRCLGRGGSASVWFVTETSTGRDYALKCFASGAAGAEGGDAEQGMRREVGILAALEHEHLVRAHAVVRVRPAPGAAGGAGDGPGLLLDYAPGGSLAGLLAGRGSLGPGETVTVLTPIAQALAYLHGQGVTHGDVAPGNVLFTAHGKPLLADLGIARMVADAGTVPPDGTAGFRDPAPVDWRAPTPGPSSSAQSRRVARLPGASAAAAVQWCLHLRESGDRGTGARRRV